MNLKGMHGATKVTRRRVLAEVISCTSLAPYHPAHFCLTLHAPEIAEGALPGCFIYILPPAPELMLRRAFSLMVCDASKGSVSILFRVVGKGTEILSKLTQGEVVDVIGPLGNGFPLFPERQAVLVGGGTGAPPLVFLGKKLQEEIIQQGIEIKPKIKVYLGARDASTLVCADEFRKLGIEPTLTTEDGSIGMRGVVTDALREGEFEEEAVVYACGPIPMLAEVARWASEKNLQGWASMESKMACGIGACLGCSVKVVDPEGNIGYERVCLDGPVFEIGRVAFDKLL